MFTITSHTTEGGVPFEETEYKGRLFRRYPTAQHNFKRYFRTSKGSEKALHRQVYIDTHGGPIPVGYCVHHIDGDVSNNDPSNLKLLTLGEHTKLHARLKRESGYTRPPRQPKAQEEPAMVRISDAARMLSVSIETLRQWEDDGKLAAVRTLGGHRRYRSEDIRKLMGDWKNRIVTKGKQ